LERIGEDDPDEEEFLRGVWEEGDDRDFVLEALKSGVEVRPRADLRGSYLLGDAFVFVPAYSSVRCY
jgi:hypothetical protein